MKGFAALRAKTYCYLIDDGSEGKKKYCQVCHKEKT